MKRVTFIILLTIIVVALVAIIVFSVNPPQQPPRVNPTNSTQPQEINNLSQRSAIISTNSQIIINGVANERK